MKKALFLFALIVTTSHLLSQNKNKFLAPPDDNRPWIFWDWMDDMITKKGITSDLEQFKKFGVRGTLIMLIGNETGNYPKWDKHNMMNPVVSQTPEFFNMWKFAAEESGRLGLTINTQCGPGWCHSGGPWVKPEQAVQHIVYTETDIVSNTAEKAVLIMNDDTLNINKDKTYLLGRPGGPHFTLDIAILAFPDKPVIDPSEVRDLTDKFRNKQFSWDMPAGKWKIRRYAIRNALAYNRPAPIGGKGLECDKLDKDAVDAMFEGMVGRFIKESPGLAGKTIRSFEADSWEVGNPEWSVKFRDEFKKRRGYDPAPWLLSYKTNTIVGNQSLTDRFKNDIYLTQTDLFADNFFTHLAKKADKLGMDFMTEPYMGPFDPIRCGGRVQVPMGEFWVSGDFLNSVRWASSSAHTYNKQTVAAEAFTGRWNDGTWTMDPYALKRVGDLALCNGVNKMILHGTALQPWGTDVKPGMPMFFWGTMFSPGQTWWNTGTAWVDYITRCQYMLSQGKNIADIVGLMPNLNWNEAMPSGLHKHYNYDLLSEEMFISAMDWKDGYFTLPSGAKYRILFLPKTHGKMEAALLQKLIVLVKKGGTVVCEDKPETAPGLTGYPAIDIRVKNLAAELYGKADGQLQTLNILGKGRLIWLENIWKDEMDQENKYFIDTRTPKKTFYGKPQSTTTWSEAFLQIVKGLDAPDVEVVKAAGKAMAWGGKPETTNGIRTGENAIAWVHRRDEKQDVYFVSNQTADGQEAEIIFRIKNRVPEIWDAESGSTYRPEKWVAEGNRIRITIPFTPFGSVFVVFKNEPEPGLMVYKPRMKTITETAISGSWNVSFPKGYGAPATARLPLGSLSKNIDAGIKYFSGTASYENTVKITKQQLQQNITLDLGMVRNIAEVYINNKPAGILWKPPFVADISDLLMEGDNVITIKVTNTWWNRMVGDEQLPEDLIWGPNVRYAGKDYKGHPLKEIPTWVWTGAERPSKDRVTFSTWRFVEKDSPLEQGGLIGPVKLVWSVKERL